jgi:hypothetical protein
MLRVHFGFFDDHFILFVQMILIHGIRMGLNDVDDESIVEFNTSARHFSYKLTVSRHKLEGDNILLALINLSLFICCLENKASLRQVT